jgi:hypothetical protein
MNSTLFAAIAAVALIGGASASASAGPAGVLDALKADAAAANMVEKAHGIHRDCEWSRYRGWHRSFNRFYSESCNPGRSWRNEGRCWIGPGGVRYCRFYG